MQSHPVRILIVDDDAMFLETMRIVLEGAGFSVTEATDGSDALRVLRGRFVDVVLCDIFMPNMDGLEVLPEIRREFPQTKVIAVSAGGSSGMVDVFKLARHLGAVEVLRKPFDNAHLLATIRRITEGTHS